MNVLFLTRRFYPDIGGVERHVFEVSRELARRGNKVTVITENPSVNYHSKYQSDTYGINSKQPVKSSQSDSYEAKGILVYRINPGQNNWIKKFRIWAALLSFFRIFKDADVVHCHDVFFWYLPFRFLFPRKKIYVTFHGYETKFPPAFNARIIRKISVKLSNGNICVGDYIKKWYGTKPDYVTYGGVLVSKDFTIETKRKLKRGKVANILLIGRLEEDNGMGIYVKALKILQKRGIAYNLTICGDGEYRTQLSKYGKALGFVGNLNKYIDRSDFIFTSSYLSIFEAIIRGKKVFSVFQNELKNDYLLLSPFYKYISVASNPILLATQLEDSIKDPEKTYNIEKISYNWAKNQTWTKVANIYLKLWKS